MLTVEHVTKKYRKTIAVNDVSFTLKPGTVTVLLGPNGAGKSTLFKSIIGFLKYSGEITIDGILNKTPEARAKMGYIPEMPALYPNLTINEHLEFLARAYKLTDYEDRAAKLRDDFELKANLCLGLLPDPELIIMDEPMVGLDPHAIKKLKEIIEQERDAGKTVIVSTHIIGSIDMLWDRVLIMQNGVLHADMTKEEVDSTGRSLEDIFFDVTEGGDR